MKYTMQDLKLKSPGVQIRDRILEKYGSIKEFSEAIDLYESSIHQYLSNKNLGSSTFKIRLTRAFGMDYHAMFESDEAQISRIVSTISLHIDAYNCYDDIKIFEAMKKIVLERELLEEYAVVCRCYAYFYYNQGLMDRALAYIEVAVNTMRGRDNIDRFGLYFSDMILMKSDRYSNAELKKIRKEFLELIQKVKGPLTRGHMYRNIGYAFKKIQNFDESFKCYKAVLNYHTDPKSVAFVYMRLGDLMGDQNNMKKALAYYQKAEAYIENPLDLHHIHHEYSRYHMMLEDLEFAEAYLDRIFDDASWDITASSSNFLDTYMEIKGKVANWDAIVACLQRLLSEMTLDYIYGTKQLIYFSDGLRHIKNPACLNRMTDEVVQYLKQHKLISSKSNQLKQLIGEIRMTL